jgi:hypothetical protein
MVDRTEWQYPGRTVGEAVLRAVTAAAVLLSADIHLEMWATGFRNIPVIGPLFLLNTAGGLVLGIALLVGRYRLVALAAAGFGALTLTAFAVSATVGLFGVQESLSGVPERLSVLAESVAVVGGVVLTVLPARAGSAGLPARAGQDGVPDRSGQGGLPDRTGQGGLPAGAGTGRPHAHPAGRRSAADGGPAATPADAGTADGDAARSGSAARDDTRPTHGWRHGARLGR